MGDRAAAPLGANAPLRDTFRPFRRNSRAARRGASHPRKRP